MSSLRGLVLVFLVFLLGCSGDDSPRSDAKAPADVVVVKEKLPGSDTACPEGEKRCETLYKIHRCVGGVWQDLVDCKTKTSGGVPCTCSATLLFVCAHNGKECP